MKTVGAVLGVLAVLILGYALAAYVYWPSMPPATGIQQPLHYNESYVWPRPWTLAQTAPGVPDPTPFAALWGANTVSQSFTAGADRLAMVRVWLAPTDGTPAVQISLLGSRDPADVLYTARFALEPHGRYYAMVFPPIRDSMGRKFFVHLTAPEAGEENPIAVRVGYVDAIGGLLYLNEYSAVGDLDLGAFYHGQPGIWTLRAIGERLLPELITKRISQYKPGWSKGGTFGLLAGLLVLGCGALLWFSWPPDRTLGPVLWRGTKAVAGTGGVILFTVVLLGWQDARVAFGIGERRVIAVPGRAVETALTRVPRVTHDLLNRLEFARRDPEARLISARWAMGWPAIVVPGESRVGYWLDMPYDAELDFRYACVGGESLLAVEIAGERIWEARTRSGEWQTATLDLRPWGGQVVALQLVSEGNGQVLWGGSQVVSERTWLSAYPPVPRPQHSKVALFGDQVELLGYDLDTSDARPGGAVELTLYWRALRPIDANYTVFVHLVDMEGKMLEQMDSQPLNGTYPTSIWSPSTVVRDKHVISVADDTVLDGYRLVVGLYELATLERLVAYDRAGKLWPDGQVLLEVDR